MEAAEKRSNDLNLPRNVWFEDSLKSGESKPNQSGKTKPKVAVSNESVTEVADNVWQAASSKTVEQSPVVVEQPVIDQEIAKDVDSLLNQKEEWFAPIPGAEEASQQLENVAFEEETHVADSMTYLDELRELEDQDSQWIQSSVVVSQGDLDASFSTSSTTLETQPMFVNELEAMVARNNPESLHSLVNVSQGRLLAQAKGDNGYNPAVEGAEATQEDQLKSLFPALSNISVTGESTTPRDTESLKRPENLAAAHMESLIPGEYVMGPVVGVAAPSRYPVCFQHNPLYFEDPNLERCGVSNGCFTTTYSAAKFLGTTLALPYLVVATPPKTCMATLGDCPTCAEFDTDAYFREWKWNR